MLGSIDGPVLATDGIPVLTPAKGESERARESERERDPA